MIIMRTYLALGALFSCSLLSAVVATKVEEVDPSKKLVNLPVVSQEAPTQNGRVATSSILDAITEDPSFLASNTVSPQPSPAIQQDTEKLIDTSPSKDVLPTPAIPVKSLLEAPVITVSETQSAVAPIGDSAIKPLEASTRAPVSPMPEGVKTPEPAIIDVIKPEVVIAPELPIADAALVQPTLLSETAPEPVKTQEPIILDMQEKLPSGEFELVEEADIKLDKKMARRKKHLASQKPPLSMADVTIKNDYPTLTKTEEQQAKEAAIATLTETGAIHLGQYLEPWKGVDEDERVEMSFDNKELTELLKFLSDVLNITFILDDYIEPVRADGLQPLAGTKITFKSTVPLSLRQAWEIGLTFIEMAGFSIIPATQPRTYRVTASASRDKASANREPLPTFIGIDPELLPDTDAKIRYVYFAENAELATVTQIVETMKSGSSGPIIEVAPLRAVIVTDKAANIKSIMSILKEIDRVTLPETLSIIRLKHTDAREIRELYHRLIGKDPKSPQLNAFSRQKKASTTHFFSEATRVFEEPYTNSLIVLGTRENIKRFEEFIKQVDKSTDIAFSPLHIIQLKYIDATSTAKILNDVIQKFNAHPANAAASLVGGVRDGNKFFRPTVRITEEPAGNRLIINGDYEEYLKIREIIDKLDVQQPQVAIKMLILNVDLSNTNELGVQLRNSQACCDGTGGTTSVLGSNVNFQTSMLGQIITNPAVGEPAPTNDNGGERLLGNLIRLADRIGDISPFGIGNTLVTLGKDLFGFWGLLRVLQTYTRTSVIANPFMVTTHKYKTEFKVGETRRTTTAIVTGQRETQAQGDLSADLRVVITPQISYDDMVDLNVYIELGQFTDETTQNRIVRKISTASLLANNEVLALGGFIRDRTVETTQKVPFFGDIPLIGWLFKFKSKIIERTSLLILICPQIIKPGIAESFTDQKFFEAKDTVQHMRVPSENRDPIHRWLFKDHKEKEISALTKFMSKKDRYIDESQMPLEENPSRKNERKNAPAQPVQRPTPANPKRKSGIIDLVSEEQI